MLKRESLPIAKIYVPAKRRATLRPEVVREIAESMLEIGQQTPILVRGDGDRFVLVEFHHCLSRPQSITLRDAAYCDTAEADAIAWMRDDNGEFNRPGA